jgi:hypothetical protein
LVEDTCNTEDIEPEGFMMTLLTLLSTGHTNNAEELPASSLGSGVGEDQTLCSPTTQFQRRLLVRDEVISLLQIDGEKVQQLINTRQILAIRIAGEERFDSWDLNTLIDSYKATAARRQQ